MYIEGADHTTRYSNAGSSRSAVATSSSQVHNVYPSNRSIAAHLIVDSGYISNNRFQMQSMYHGGREGRIPCWVIFYPPQPWQICCRDCIPHTESHWRESKQQNQNTAPELQWSANAPLGPSSLLPRHLMLLLALVIHLDFQVTATPAPCSGACQQRLLCLSWTQKPREFEIVQSLLTKHCLRCRREYFSAKIITSAPVPQNMKKPSARQVWDLRERYYNHVNKPIQKKIGEPVKLFVNAVKISKVESVPSPSA